MHFGFCGAKQLIDVFLIADSSALSTIQSCLAAYSDIHLIGNAATAEQALTDIARLKPDVICSQAKLSGQSCLPLVEQIMEHQATPILILSSNDEPAFLAAGAVEVLVKPTPFSEAVFGKEIARKLKILSGVMVFSRVANTAIAATPASPLPQAATQAAAKPALVIIGASTGGPNALEAVLSKLPTDYPLPIVCIQHISQGFLEPFISWLNGKVKLPVSIARAGQLPENGHIYFAPDHANLEFDHQGRFRYSTAAEYLHYPCVNVSFHSAAHFYSNHTVAILLTGMGEDGADGLKTIAQAGGTTIAQDQASATVFGMPKAAIENGAAQQVLNLEQIAAALCKLRK